MNRLKRPTLAAAVLATISGSSYYYFYHPKPKEQNSFNLSYRVRAQNGNIGTATTTIPLLSQAALEELINARNTRHAFVNAGRKWIWHTAQIPSNDPIEDTIAHSVIQHDGGETLCLAVMDGHGGPWTSKLLEKILIPSVAFELELLRKQNQSNYAYKLLGKVYSYFTPAPPLAIGDGLADVNTISQSIQSAFLKIDKKILDAPLLYLQKLNQREDLKNDELFPDILLPAKSGISTPSHRIRAN